LRSLTLAPYLNRVGRRRRLLAALLFAGLVLFLAGPARGASLLYIRGGGYGHGIGMSQYGAYGYALHGEDYRFILAHYYQGTALGTTPPNQIVRVLLGSGAASFSGASAAPGTHLNAGLTYTVKAVANGRLIILDANGKRVGTSFAAPLTVIGPGPLNVSGLGTYRGELQFRPSGSGVQTVNLVGLDDYVRGVVAAEMPAGWPAQALEAQAVAARTYAVTTSVSGNGFDLYDDTRSQMYGGVGSETPATDAAVAATRGQIVTYNGQPAVTYFFASSGGYTESIQNVWPGSSPEPWLRGVPDPYDGAGADPYHQWSQQMSLSAAAAKLGGLVKGRLTGITITAHGVSPRILRAAVVGTRGRTSVTGDTLQQAFSLPTTLASFTTVTSQASATTLRGSVYPAHSGTYLLQALRAHGWHTLSRRKLRGGNYLAPLPGPGRYRIQFDGLLGPPVSAPKVNALLLRTAARQELRALVRLGGGRGPALPQDRLARYAWPLAGHRRPLRPVPVVLRAP
jgi:stage II sporulation protein D